MSGSKELNVYYSRSNGVNDKIIFPVVSEVLNGIKAVFNLPSAILGYHERGTDYSCKSLDKADIVLVGEDDGCHFIGKGTYEEIMRSFERGVPVFLISQVYAESEYKFMIQEIKPEDVSQITLNQSYQDYAQISRYRYIHSAVVGIPNTSLDPQKFAQQVTNFHKALKELMPNVAIGKDVTPQPVVENVIVKPSNKSSDDELLLLLG